MVRTEGDSLGGLEQYSRVRTRLLARVLLLLAWPTIAFAHSPAIELTFWGGFPEAEARCQRGIARAAASCINGSWRARAACHSATLEGESCDQPATDAAVQSARETALSMVESICTLQDLRNLHYVDMADAFADVIGVCRQLDKATDSAVFGPMNSGGSSEVDPVTAGCISSTATATTKLLWVALRSRQRALDRIAAAVFPLERKQALLEQAEHKIALARARLERRLARACPGSSFESVYGREVGEFLATLAAQSDCLAESVYVQDAVRCPAAVCGNGMEERGEECDDGNQQDGDFCRNDCRKSECQTFPSTFALIQAAIFEKKGCTSDACHGAAQQGAMDLRAGVSYDNIVDVQAVSSLLDRIEPGDQELSVLWLRVAKATLGRNEIPGSPMPPGLPPLSIDELEALRLWIYAGAPREGTVPGTGERLNACLPDPEPIEIAPLPPPTPGTGVQLHMPPWTLAAQSENEVCFATYFDIRDQVPAEARGEDGESFCFNSSFVRQNPVSHHLAGHLYTGRASPTDPAWGTWTCRGGAHDGAGCDPTDLGACGSDGSCATGLRSSTACIGFGPPDADPLSLAGFAGAGETANGGSMPPGVYGCMAMKGVILWNAHSFNLTKSPATSEAWVNFEFATDDERQYPAQVSVNSEQVFKMDVPPYSTQEVCHASVIPSGALVTGVGPHTHKRGKRFQVFRGSFRCSGGPRQGEYCTPLTPNFCGDGISCRDVGGRDPAQSLLYTNFLYNDPVAGGFYPPLAFSGSAAERSLTYCALYDNGSANPATVKRRSTIANSPFATPCQPTHCAEGNVGAACRGSTQTQRDSSCDSSPNAHDGFCDACVLRGGLTTDDEMFILTTSYYVP